MKSISIKQNIVFSFIEKVFLSLSAFLLIPYIIHNIGLAEYGIWVLFLSFSSYISLAQFGLSSSFEKYIAQFHALDQQQKLKELVATSFYALFAISIVTFMIIATLTPYFFDHFFKAPNSNAYSTLFIVIVGFTMLSLPTQVFNAIPRGIQRFDISSASSIVSKTLEIIVTVIALKSQNNVTALAWGMGVSTVASMVLNTVIASQLLRSISLNPQLFRLSLLMEMYKFGINMQVSLFTMWIVQNVDKVIIGKLLGPSAVAIYDIGSKLVSMLRQIMGVVFFTMIPKASELNAQNQQERLQHMYVYGSRLVAAFSLGLGAFLYPIAGDILKIWLHTTPDPASITIFRVLIIGVSIHQVTGLGSSIIRGLGKPILETYSNSAIAILNVGLSLFFFWLGNLAGIAWGTSVAAILGTFFFLFLVNKTMNVPFFTFIKDVFLWPISTGTAIIIGGIFLHQVIYKSIPDNHPIFVICIIVAAQSLLSALILIPSYWLNGLIGLNPFRLNRS